MTETRNSFIRSGKISLRLLRLTGWALALLLQFALLHLLFIGVPAGTVRQFTRYAQRAGLLLDMDSVRLSPFHGLVLQNVRVYSTSSDDLTPLLQARRLTVWLWPVDWRHPARRGLDVTLSSPNIAVSLGQPWKELLPEDHPFRSAKQMTATLTFRRRELVVGHAAVLWGGIQFQASGTMEFSGGGTRLELPAHACRKAAETARNLATLEFKRPPQIHLRFNTYAAQPEAVLLDGALSIEGLSLHGKTYGRIDSAVHLRNRQLSLTDLQIAQPDGTCLNAAGSLDLDTQTAELTLDNTLSVGDLLGLLPERIRPDLAAWNTAPYGALDFHMECGPASRENLFDRIRAEVREASLRRDDTVFAPLAFRLLRDGSRLEVSDLRTAVNGGPLEGQFRMDTASRAWSADVRARCDPALLRPLAGKALMKFIDRFTFTGSMPDVRMALSQTGKGAPLQFSGNLTADRFVCAGIPLDRLETSLSYSNRILDLNALRISGGNRQFTGDVRVDFPRRLGFFDAASSFDPPTIARVLAPKHPTVLDQLRFEGPVYAEGRGCVDYGAGTDQSFRGTLRAEQTGTGPLSLQLDYFDTQIEGRGTQLLFTNTAFRLCGGSGEGSAEFDLIQRDGQAPYRINAAVSRVDFAKLLEQIYPGPARARGQLSGTIHFTADAGTGFWNSVQGGGSVEIAKGHLAELPLLGGFSRLIQTSFPMFSFFSISSFFADYELRNGAVWSENVELGSALLSARARGNYSPSGGLDFVLQAYPLQPAKAHAKWYRPDRPAAEALRWITSPFFNFLEFQLSGSLTKPEWHFVNLPKDVTDLLQRVPGRQPSGESRP